MIPARQWVADVGMLTCSSQLSTNCRKQKEIQKMLRKLSLFPALLALLTVTIILVAQNAVAQKTSLPIRIGQVTLNSTHVDS
jgi:hypothetical protein